MACALVLCTCAWAQGGGWAAVEGIPPGATVKVERLRAKTITGMLTGASASGIDVRTSSGATHHLGQKRIKKVYLVGKGYKVRDGLIGAAAGAAAGAVAGYAVAFDGYDYNEHTGLPYHQDSRPAGIALGGLLGAVIGSAIGAIIGPGRSKTLVYSGTPSATAGTLDAAGGPPAPPGPR